MLLTSDYENDRVKCENQSDLEDEDYVAVHSEDSDTEQDISSEECEEKLDMNEECFVRKDKKIKMEEKSNKIN